MPPTTSFEFGDIVLVPFPFTNQAGTKRRSAVVDVHRAGVLMQVNYRAGG